MHQTSHAGNKSTTAVRQRTHLKAVEDPGQYISTKPDKIVHEVVSTPICNEQREVVYVTEEYHSSVQEFRGLIAMCSYCKKIRMEDREWVEVEKYIEPHTTAQHSHGYCEDCLEEIKDKI